MQLQGIIPPVVTPFTASGDLDTDALQKVIAALEPDVDGLLILGSNGEVAYLTTAERKRVLEAAREAIPHAKPMIVGVVAEATAHAAQQAREAADIGADAVLVLAPHYYKASMTPDVLEMHFRAVAGASPLPVYVYNIPQVSGIAHAPAWMAKVAGIPNIAGFKDSSGDTLNLTEMLRQAPTMNGLTGNAPTLLPALAVGAAGGILAAVNAIPRHFGALLRAFKAGDMARALELQRATNPMSFAVTSGYGVSGLKAVMRLQGKAAGFPRAPLQDVNTEASKKLEAILETLPSV
jgi:4-hydroxy-2-oxoglutarate aldolase